MLIISVLLLLTLVPLVTIHSISLQTNTDGDIDEFLQRKLLLEFERCDSDNDGVITYEEFSTLIQENNSSQILDGNGDHMIDYPELVYWIKQLHAKQLYQQLYMNELVHIIGIKYNDDIEAELQANVIFYTLDSNNNNYVAIKDFELYQIDEAWFSIASHDNVIDFNEFMWLLEMYFLPATSSGLKGSTINDTLVFNCHDMDELISKYEKSNSSIASKYMDFHFVRRLSIDNHRFEQHFVKEIDNYHDQQDMADRLYGFEDDLDKWLDNLSDEQIDYYYDILTDQTVQNTPMSDENVHFINDVIKYERCHEFFQRLVDNKEKACAVFTTETARMEQPPHTKDKCGFELFPHNAIRCKIEFLGIRLKFWERDRSQNPDLHCSTDHVHTLKPKECVDLECKGKHYKRCGELDRYKCGPYEISPFKMPKPDVLNCKVGSSFNKPIPINIKHECNSDTECTNTKTLSLVMETCDTNNKHQQWNYDSSTHLLRASAYSNAHCVVSNGKPFKDDYTMTEFNSKTVPCDSNNKQQHWMFEGEQFKSTHHNCLDVWGGSAVTEWNCKSPTNNNAANQQWTISGKQIRSKSNGKCLSAKPYVIKPYVLKKQDVGPVNDYLAMLLAEYLKSVLPLIYPDPYEESGRPIIKVFQVIPSFIPTHIDPSRTKNQYYFMPFVPGVNKWIVDADEEKNEKLRKKNENVEIVIPVFNAKGNKCQECPKRKTLFNSLRGAFIMQILLEANDRHPGNIQISKDCQVMNIDYGHFMGDKTFAHKHKFPYKLMYNPELDEYLKLIGMKEKFIETLSDDLYRIKSYFKRTSYKSLKSYFKPYRPWMSDKHVPKFVKKIVDNLSFSERNSKKSATILNENSLKMDMKYMEEQVGGHLIWQYYPDWTPLRIVAYVRHKNSVQSGSYYYTKTDEGKEFAKELQESKKLGTCEKKKKRKFK